MIEPRYYYYRDDRRRPVVAVCALIDVERKTVVSRGLAVCHSKDNFYKERGRRLAYNRANATLCNSRDMLPIKVRDELDRILDLIPTKDVMAGVFDFKGRTMPEMTEVEKRLLKGMANKAVKTPNTDIIVCQEDDGAID